MSIPPVVVRITAEDDGVAAAVQQLTRDLKGLQTQSAKNAGTFNQFTHATSSAEPGLRR